MSASFALYELRRIIPLLIIIFLVGGICDCVEVPDWIQGNISYYIVNGPEGEEELNLTWLQPSEAPPIRDPGSPLWVLLHGLGGSHRATFPLLIARALMTLGKENILIVDYGPLVPASDYGLAARSTSKIGKSLAAYLATAPEGTPLRLVGFSVGAQVAGVTGHRLRTEFNQTVERIIALDPTDVLFSDLPAETRLDPGDADFVMAVHTGGGAIGSLLSLGHVDFYPNGGFAPQPHCRVPAAAPEDTFRTMGIKMLLEVMCSHTAAYLYLSESVRGGFTATRCASWWRYETGQCAGQPTTPMTFELSSNLRGRFFMTTRSEEPFDLGSDYSDSDYTADHSDFPAVSSDAPRRDGDIWDLLYGLLIIFCQLTSIYVIWIYTPY